MAVFLCLTAAAPTAVTIPANTTMTTTDSHTGGSVGATPPDKSTRSADTP